MKLPQPMATHTAPGQAFIAAPDPYDFFFVFFSFLKAAARSSPWVAARTRECMRAGTLLLFHNSALEDELPPNHPLDACSRQIPLSPLACLSLAGSSTLSTNPFSRPFPKNPGQEPQPPGLPASSPAARQELQGDTPAGSGAALAGSWSCATGQTQSFLPQAAPATAVVVAQTRYPQHSLHPKIREPTEGPAPGDPQTFHCVTRASSAENPPKARGKGRKAKRPAGLVLAAGSGAQCCSRQSHGAEAEQSTSPSPFPLPSPAEPHGWTRTAGPTQLETHSWNHTAGSSGGLQGVGWGQEGLWDPNRAVGPQGELWDPDRAVGSRRWLGGPG